jgi:hypothetical protein
MYMYNAQGQYLYLTEERDVAWNIRKMGSTQVGETREGPAPQAGSKISS